MLRVYLAAVLWYYLVWCLLGVLEAPDTATYIDWLPWRTPVVPLAWRPFTLLSPEPLLWISLAQVLVAGLVPCFGLWLGREAQSETAGRVAAAWLILNPGIWASICMPLTEVWFTALLWPATWALLRGRVKTAGWLAGALALTRPAALFWPVVGFGFIRRWSFLIIFGAAVGWWFIPQSLIFDKLSSITAGQTNGKAENLKQYGINLLAIYTAQQEADWLVIMLRNREVNQISDKPEHMINELSRAYRWSGWTLVPLGALLLLVMKPRLGWLSLANVSYYVGVGALVAGTSRFRIPGEPFMALCAGFTINQALTGFKNCPKIFLRGNHER